MYQWFYNIHLDYFRSFWQKRIYIFLLKFIALIYLNNICKPKKYSICKVIINNYICMIISCLTVQIFLSIYLSAYLMVTLGMGWKPSSLAGRAGEPVQKYTRSWRSRGDIFSITDHSQRLKVTSLNITRNNAKIKMLLLWFHLH